MSGSEAGKRAAAEAAAALVRDGMLVGLGSGSTVKHLVVALGLRVREGLRIVGIPTSTETEALALAHGIALTEPDTTEIDLTANALANDGHLDTFSGFVEDSGEGRWTIEAAVEEAVPAEVLAAALFTRFRSRQEHTFAEKMLSAMRLGFGGHVEQHGDGKPA